MLYEAKQDLARHLVKRQKLDHKIARLQAVVSDLQNLCAEQDQKNFENRVERVIKKDLKVGITESARVILQENFFPLTASELKERIEARKIQIARYASPLAVIHTILKRLVHSGDVRIVPQTNGKKAYQWVSPTDKALSELHKSSQPAVPKLGSLKEPK
jgi:fibronectin type 3 domain-containing protein